jgi:hypothetical protein
MSTKRTTTSAVGGVVPSGSAHWECQFMFVSWFMSAQINKNKRLGSKMCTASTTSSTSTSVWRVSQLGSVKDVWRVSLIGCVSDVFVCCTRLTCLRSGTCVRNDMCVFFWGGCSSEEVRRCPNNEACCAGTQGILCGTDFAYV